MTTTSGATPSPDNQPAARLARLQGYLAADPENLNLIAEAAAVALEAHDLEASSDLIARYEAIEPAPPSLLNLKGLVALNQQRFDEAATIFAGLLDQDDVAITFNLAWAKAMLQDYDGALAILDGPVLEASPRAASLKVQMLHHLGELEQALACGQDLADRFPNDQALMGALSTVAIDLENLDLAKTYAQRAGDSADGLATMGMVMLSDERVGDARPYFERSLAINPKDARAELGRGLVLMVEGQTAAAAHSIDRAAELFGRHVGSWVASGWAHYIRGDRLASRASFERALSLDDRFAETHGALAVLDIAEGDLESAKRRTEIALRLDRRCLAGALAKSLLLMGEGHVEAAERVRALAMNAPLGASGKTLAQAIMGLSLGSPKGAGKA